MGELGESEKNNVTRFYEGLAPLYIICRLSGIFPLEARRIRGNISMSPQKSDRIYFLCYFTVYFLLSTHATYSVITDNVSYVIIPKKFVLSEALIVIILMLITMFFSFYFRKLLLDCVRLLAAVDVTFLSLDIKINYMKSRRNNFNIFGIMLTSVLVRSLMMSATVQIDIVQQITLFIATFIKSLSKYEFIGLLLPIAVRFNKLNRQICAYKREKFEPKLKSNLYILCRMHFKLCNISRTLNACFAFQLLSSLGVSLTDILFQSFYLYVVLTKKMSIASGYMIASPIIWLVDECLEIYLLVNACSMTCQTANKTAILLHELRNNVKENELDTHIQMYSIQMLHQKLEFSALGFFSIDYALLYSILGAVTTYLVIFIQFDQSSDSKEYSAAQMENCSLHN